MKLDKETKTLIRNYCQFNNLSKDVLLNFITCDGDVDILVSLQKFIALDGEKISVIWTHVINDLWDGKDLHTIFGKGELIIFRELLNNRGVLTLKYVRSIMRTPHMGCSAANNLVDAGLFDKVRNTSKNVLYVLNYVFYEEVFG